VIEGRLANHCTSARSPAPAQQGVAAHPYPFRAPFCGRRASRPRTCGGRRAGNLRIRWITGTPRANSFRSGALFGPRSLILGAGRGRTITGRSRTRPPSVVSWPPPVTRRVPSFRLRPVPRVLVPPVPVPRVPVPGVSAARVPVRRVSVLRAPVSLRPVSVRRPPVRWQSVSRRPASHGPLLGPRRPLLALRRPHLGTWRPPLGLRRPRFGLRRPRFGLRPARLRLRRAPGLRPSRFRPGHPSRFRLPSCLRPLDLWPPSRYRRRPRPGPRRLAAHG
jgi:hypothetical protein